MKEGSIYIVGMHGLGDCVHQRAVLRQLRETFRDIWLETTWPQIYHDMPDLKLLKRGTQLRTQLKNANRHNDRFEEYPEPDENRTHLTISYRPDQVRRDGSVLKAMMHSAGTNPHKADYSLPIPADWKEKAHYLVQSLFITKPIMVYRPLIERTEWTGCKNRNADHEAYAALVESVRDQFFVVSIADTAPGKEWIVGRDIHADAEFHHGELDFETVAALIDRASLVISSPGFAVVLARALKTPAVVVVGGYENSRSFSIGDGPFLGIDPIRPCQCFSHTHPCDKTINLPLAIHNLKEFAHAASRPTKG